METDIIFTIRQELQQQVDEKTKSGSQRFFKEEVAFYGVNTAVVIRIAKKYFPLVKPLGKKGIFAFCEKLLKSDYMEEAFIAFDWSYRLHYEYEAGDFAVFEKWLVRYVNNWAKCDTLCNHTIASLVEKYPQFIANLKRWAKSENRWLRRASAVTLIIPAKEGKFLADIIEIADSLLEDKDDMVQGIRMASERRQHQAPKRNL